MSPEKVRFRFVYVNCASGYTHDISHFVTNEVTIAKPVQTLPIAQKLQNLGRFRQCCLKELFEKISHWGNGFTKRFLSLLET